MQQLNNTTVARTPRPITILQFGAGNFLRGFADWMIQRANDSGLTNHGVAIAYATNRPGPRHDPLIAQDGLYHVCLEGIKDGRPTRQIDLVEVVQEVVDPYHDYDAFQRIALSPELRIILSNTTEAGIAYREDDLAARPPASFPAQVAQLLHDRYLAFAGSDAAGLAILCCELIEANGENLRGYVVRHAERAGWGEGFLSWLERANHFYDTLVDRIVSGFPADDAAGLQQEVGFEDRALVKGEFFALWVIGGDPGIRELLPLDQLGLGVSFVPRDEVGPFRDKKVRILNGCHTAMSQLGLQIGTEIVGEAFADADLRRYLTTLISDEVLPTIEGDPATLRRFAAAILERFDNPYLKHRLADINLNSVSKWKARNLPVVLDRWREGHSACLSVFSLAALLVLYSGHSANPEFTPRDEAVYLEAIRGNFSPSAPDAWVSASLDAIGLGELPESVRLATEVTAAAASILRDGPRLALRQLLADRPVPTHTGVGALTSAPLTV
ncbi:MAG TPA: tagaturonate reductase [Propionicimonas sp.]